MSDLSTLKGIIENQVEKGIRNGDWPRHRYSVSKIDVHHFRLKIEDLQVGFVFSRKGRFIGAYNWKE